MEKKTVEFQMVDTSIVGTVLRMVGQSFQWECLNCGAVVTDREAHKRWHRRRRDEKTK